MLPDPHPPAPPADQAGPTHALEAPIDCALVLDRTPWKNRKPRQRLTISYLGSHASVRKTPTVVKTTSSPTQFDPMAWANPPLRDMAGLS
eukprot:6347013-Prymnesium_polylepis.1